MMIGHRKRGFYELPNWGGAIERSRSCSFVMPVSENLEGLDGGLHKEWGFRKLMDFMMSEFSAFGPLDLLPFLFLRIFGPLKL